MCTLKALRGPQKTSDQKTKYHRYDTVYSYCSIYSTIINIFNMQYLLLHISLLHLNLIHLLYINALAFLLSLGSQAEAPVFLQSILYQAEQTIVYEKKLLVGFHYFLLSKPLNHVTSVSSVIHTDAWLLQIVMVQLRQEAVFYGI